MKKNLSYIALAVAIATSLAILFTSCSSMEDEGTGYPLKLSAINEAASEVPEIALSEESPCRVVAFARDRACEPYFFLFEDTAYVSQGKLQWIEKFHYWPGVYTKFVAYWPADSKVELDESGNVISSDCILIAITGPYNHFSESPTLKFYPYKSASTQSR